MNSNLRKNMISLVRLVFGMLSVSFFVYGCSEKREETAAYQPDGRLCNAITNLMGKVFDDRYCPCFWKCQTNGIFDVSSQSFEGVELPFFRMPEIYVTPISRRCYRIGSLALLNDKSELEKVQKEVALMAALRTVTNSVGPRTYNVEHWCTTESGLNLHMEEVGVECDSNKWVWCSIDVVNTNLEKVAYAESQQLACRAEGLELLGKTTGRKVDVANESLIDEGKDIAVHFETNLYEHACAISYAEVTAISNIAYSVVAKIEAKPNALTNLSERIIEEYEKKYPNRFVCVEANTNSISWIMPFFRGNGSSQRVTVFLTTDSCVVEVNDDDVKARAGSEYKIYKSRKREEDLLKESKRFQIEDLFGIGLGWYQRESEKLDAKRIADGDDGELEYCSDCLNPSDYQRYLGLGLTGYAVRKKSRRTCVLLAESESMTRESAKSVGRKIAEDLSKRLEVEGECEVRSDGKWSWQWDWDDIDGHHMRIYMSEYGEGRGRFSILMYINDLTFRHGNSKEEFSSPSGISLGRPGALEYLGCVVSPEPCEVKNGRSRYEVLPTRKGLYLAELPISSVSIDSKGCAVAVSYGMTNQMEEAEIKEALKTIRLIVENSLWQVGSEEHFRFGADKGVSSYYWKLDSAKPKGSIDIFLHGGKSAKAPPIGLDIFWQGESHPEQREEIYEEASPLDLFALTKKSIVFLSGAKTAGSGFIVQKGAKSYVYTNRHVVDHGAIIVKDIQGKLLKVVGQENAIGLDISRLELKEPRQGLVFTTAIPSIGDGITVIGDSDGVGAATKLEGKVIAVGPKVLELSAQFIPGNSGSPVLRSDGKVIGIATFGYDAYNPADRFKRGTRFNGVRRFALRIPEDIKWQAVW